MKFNRFGKIALFLAGFLCSGPIYAGTTLQTPVTTGTTPLYPGSIVFGGLTPTADWTLASPFNYNLYSIGGPLSMQSLTYNNQFGLGIYTVTTPTSAPSSSGADYMKGGLYVFNQTQDHFETSPSFKPRASNGISTYSQIPSNNQNAYVEALVAVAQIQAGGDGQAVAGEFDIYNYSNLTQSPPVSAHCDAGIPKCKVNIWLGSAGNSPVSWMIDSSNGPPSAACLAGNCTNSGNVGGESPGWLNGISLRNIRVNGQALNIPNSTFITSRNKDNNNDLIMMHVDANDVLQLGFGTKTNAIMNGVHPNTNGYKAVRGIAGCTTPAVIGGTCNTTFTFNPPFLDTNYTVTGCIGNEIASGVPIIQGVAAKQAGSIVVRTAALTAAAARFSTIECTFIHD